MSQDAGYNSDWYKRQFVEMATVASNMSQVLADIKAADAEEKAAKLTPHQMQTRIQALFDLADGDCIDILEDALTDINYRCKEIERTEQETEEAYEVQAMRGSSAPREI